MVGTLAAADDSAPVARSESAGRRRKRRQITIGDRQVFTHGLPRRFWQDLYHLSMTIGWPTLFAVLAAFFFTLNLFFGSLYTLTPGSIANLNPQYLILYDRVMVSGSGLGDDDFGEVRTKAAEFVRTHATRTGTIEDPFYGDLEIYRVGGAEAH